MLHRFLRKYATALSGGTKIRVPIYVTASVNFSTGATWTPAAGDVLVSIDGAAEANIATLPAYANGAWEFTLSAAELTGKTVTVRVEDAAIADTMLVVETVGDPSALHQHLTLDYPMGYAGATTVTFSKWFGRVMAVLFGKVTGARSGLEKFYHPDGTTESVRETVDNAGNRTPSFQD